MPDLSGLDSKNTLNLLLSTRYGGRGLQTEPARAYLTNLARLVDKTILEYESAREYLQRYVNSSNKTSLYLRCEDHMETCADTLRRALLYAERPRKDRPTPKIVKPELPSPKASERIIRIRNAIQHVDEKVGAERGPIGLMVKGDSIELDGEEIRFDELAL